MKITLRIILLTVFSFSFLLSNAKTIDVSSPNKTYKSEIVVGEKVSINVFQDGEMLFSVNDIYMDTSIGFIPANNSSVRSVKRNTVNRMVSPEIKEKKGKILENYNEVIIQLKDKVKLQVRAYDNGVAYRFVTSINKEIVIKDECAEFAFDTASVVTFQEDNNMNSAYEAPYVKKSINQIKSLNKGNLPALVTVPGGTNVLFLESETKDYPCLWIEKGEKNIQAHFWPYPKIYNVNGSSYSRRQILSCEDYIAKVNGNREFPWRVFALSKDDLGLLSNQLVYLLASECKIDDTSWIKPGWVTFDWWARRGLYGVDFESGINTETAKYMIDFASKFNVRYFLFDDGWTKNDDLCETIDGLDMKTVVDYAKGKNVDVMLWVTYDLIDSQMDKALKKFDEWGIKGLKIDFINRSDQEATNFYWKAAQKASEHKMVLDFHGAYRPDGLRRAYPNVLTREALIEFEQSGGTYNDNPDHHCTLPFIRNVAGPMDYIPGTMNNSTKNSFRFNFDTPMGQGTRAHAIALAVIAESPMQMLPDSQSDYYREEECTKFLTSIPVEWDEFLPLEAKIGDYVTMARKSGNSWYIGAITDWTPRKTQIKLDFLSEGKNYVMEIISDGINANKRAIDYKKESKAVRKGDVIDIDMASGGGWVACISEK